jgi:hypothetical protein
VEMIVACSFRNSENLENVLSLEEGQVLDVERAVGEPWWWGTRQVDGQEGWIPASHVKRHKLAASPETKVTKSQSSFLETTTIAGVGKILGHLHDL